MGPAKSAASAHHTQTALPACSSVKILRMRFQAAMYWLASADTALYQAKRSGRNRVEAAEELPLSLENWRRKTAGLPAPAKGAPAKPATATA